MSVHHEVPFSVDTMVWGTFDAATKPVIEIASGDTVSLRALPACLPSRLPSPETHNIPPLLIEAMQTLPPGPSGHILTGPIVVKGAMPGDVLQVDILDVKCWMDWGYVSFGPLKGALPNDFPDPAIIHPFIDHTAGLIRFVKGVTLPIAPFFGIMGVAPPAIWAKQPSAVPRAFGGNLDNKELRAGTTLYLPVFVPGAHFSAGDGHGTQGDGEVCINGLETGLDGTFRLTVRKDLGWTWPFAESETHLIAMGIDEDLDEAARQALREMILHITRSSTLTRNEAYMLCSLAGDMRVTQLVNGNKGVHMMMAKSTIQ